MPHQRETWLEALHLCNYRRFSDLDLYFQPDLTVIVAENGGGKTALLDAIAIALRCFKSGLLGVRSRGFNPSDALLARSATGSMAAVLPITLEAAGTIDGHATTWELELPSLDGKTIYSEAEELADRGRTLRNELHDYAAGHRTEPPPLPLIAYYGTGQLWSECKLTKRKKKAATDFTQRTSAYLDCLSPSSDYDQFALWFEWMVREAQGESQGESSPQSLLIAFRQAVDTVLEPSGWKNLDWDSLSKEVVAHHEQYGRLPVRMLGDGMRNLIALVADLAHRAVRLNPHLGEKVCEESTGIVLIDEVDGHLHPSWQQKVVGLLREAFPALQLILTTHSHLLISTIPSTSIRVILDDGTVELPDVEIQGSESSFALGYVFGVDSAPPIEIVRRLSQYRSLIEQGLAESSEAEALCGELVEHFGPSHPAIVTTESLLRLQKLKKVRAS